ncbi:MAG TPA: phasin family protein [Anaerolineaceae bacterium]|nr:phasin family protein [Anaerolineaceae bacterium]
MQKEMIELIEKTTETAMESARKIGELNQRTFEKLFQHQADLAAFYMDASARGLELMTKAKGYQDLIAGQTTLLRECGERNMSALRDSMAFANESSTEYGTMLQEGVKLAQEQAARASSMIKVAA